MRSAPPSSPLGSPRGDTLPILFTVLCLLAAAIPGPDPANAQEGSFGETVDVELVNVEVWVTDRKGRPISGLTAADFEVREDGKRVEITHFTEVSASSPAALAAVTLEALADEDEPAEEAPAEEISEDQYLVVYFDLLHLNPISRKRLVEDVRDFLARGDIPSQRVLVLSQTDQLRTILPFGSSTEQLAQVFSLMVSTSPPVMAQPEIEKRRTLQRLQEIWKEIALLTGSASSGPRAANAPSAAPCTAFARRSVQEVTVYARQAQQRIGATLAHLTDTAAVLAGLPGVKSLLYLSDGLETTPGADLLQFINGLCPAATQEAPELALPDVLSEPFRILTRHASANRVTFYALQAGGLRSSLTGTADQISLDNRAASSFELANRTNNRDGLSFLAAETGGRAVFNQNRLGGALERVASEMTTYYSLAYVPSHGGDGAEHRIGVKVKVPKTQVRHRKGYRDKNTDERMAERLQSALFLGLVDNPLAVRLGAGTVRASTGGKLVLPLHVLVPPDGVVFLPQEGGDFAQLKVQVAARNDRNQKVDFLQQEFRLERPAAGQKLMALSVELELGAGVHVVAVGLRDTASLETSYISTALEVALPPDEGP